MPSDDDARGRRQRGDRDTEPIPDVGLPRHEMSEPREPVMAGPAFPPDPPEPPEIGDPPPLPELPEAEFDGLRYDAIGLPVGPRRVLPLEPEPSPLVARYLFPTEKYRGEWRRHWIHLFPHLVLGVLATFIMGYLSGVFARNEASGMMSSVVVIWLCVLSWVGWKVLDWYYDRFILTNKRVMVVAGIITRQVAMMPLLRVTDMKYQQSPMGRLMSYGTFILESAGQEQALRDIKHLPNPNELYLRICEEMYEPEAVEARLSGGSDEPEGGNDA